MTTDFVDSKTAAQRLRSARNVLLLCHKNPDGDTIGCAGALTLALKSLGKTVAVLCNDPIPSLYDYMDLPWFDGSFTPDYVVAVDVAGTQLFGDKNNMPRYAEHVRLCIDHHASNSGYADETLLDANAAAACEVMTKVIEAMDVRLTPAIAGCLYTGIVTDTGGFRFSSTTADTHKAAAHLMEAGADVTWLNQHLFENRSRARMKIELAALQSLQYHLNGLCAMVCLTWDQIEASGVAAAELEDLTSLPRSIEGVKVGLTLRQQKDGSFRVSVRTDGEVDACAIARRLGGGGHARAAGCELAGNPDYACQALLVEVEKELKKLNKK